MIKVLTTFWLNKCSRLTLYFPCYRLEIAISPQNPGSFYWGMIFRNQDLVLRYAHCYWGVPSIVLLQKLDFPL